MHLYNEVVRCSKRIVAGASSFQVGDHKSGTRCHHESDGPPLRSYLFDMEKDGGGGGGGNDIFARYAEQTLAALRDLVSDFPTLSLHNRVALLVPNTSFLDAFKPELRRTLSERFELISSREAAAVMTHPGGGTG